MPSLPENTEQMRPRPPTQVPGGRRAQTSLKTQHTGKQRSTPNVHSHIRLATATRFNTRSRQSGFLPFAVISLQHRQGALLIDSAQGRLLGGSGKTRHCSPGCRPKKGTGGEGWPLSWLLSRGLARGTRPLTQVPDHCSPDIKVLNSMARQAPMPLQISRSLRPAAKAAVHSAARLKHAEHSAYANGDRRGVGSSLSGPAGPGCGNLGTDLFRQPGAPGRRSPAAPPLARLAAECPAALNSARAQPRQARAPPLPLSRLAAPGGSAQLAQQCSTSMCTALECTAQPDC